MITKDKIDNYRLQILNDMLNSKSLLIKINLKYATCYNDVLEPIPIQEIESDIFFSTELKSLNVKENILYIHENDIHIDIPIEHITFVLDYETHIALSISIHNNSFSIQKISQDIVAKAYEQDEQLSNLIIRLNKYFETIMYKNNIHLQIMHLNLSNLPENMFALNDGSVPENSIATVYIPSV